MDEAVLLMVGLAFSKLISVWYRGTVPAEVHLFSIKAMHQGMVTYTILGLQLATFTGVTSRCT